MKSERPPLVVVDDPEMIAPLREELESRGWKLQNGWPAARAWRTGEQRLVCVGTVESPEEREAALAAVLVAGLGLLTVVPQENPASFLEDLARVDDVERRRRAAVSHPQLTVEQTELLRALAKGLGVGTVAKASYISRRTAYRELERARIALRVETNREAFAEVARWEASRG